MELATEVQILKEAVYISFSPNALRNGMDPFVLPLARGKY